VPFERGEPPGKVATLQLCSNKICLIVQLIHLSTIPASLINLLENPNIRKVGVGIRADCTKLNGDYNLLVGGAEDIRPLFQPYRPPNLQLETLVKCFLKLKLPKPGHLRISDWNIQQLSPDQIQYAVNDAFAGLRLYEKAMAMKINPEQAESLTIENSNHADETQLDYQRVCLDAYHFMDRYAVPKLHPLYAPFLRLLREALFIVDKNDLDQAKKVLLNRGLTQSEVNTVSLRHLLSKGRVARTIPKVGRQMLQNSCRLLFFIIQRSRPPL